MQSLQENMSMAMASDTVTDFKEDTMNSQTDEGVSQLKQDLKEVEGRLVSLSDKMHLCDIILNDLKDLSDVLVRKSLQDVSAPQK